MTEAFEEQARAIRLGLGAAPAFALVEGRPDKAVIKRFLHPSVVIVVAGGKRPLWHLAAAFEESPNVFAVADRDFDLLLGATAPANIFFWDFADLEATAAFAGALEYVIDSYCAVGKVEQFCENEARSLEDALVERLGHLGALRLVSARDKHDLPFRQVPIFKFVDKQSLAIDLGRYSAALVSKARDGLPNASTIIQSAGDARPQFADRDLVRGHDLAAVLAVGVRSVLGNRRSSLDELAENIEIAIRGAFDPEMIRSSSIGDAVINLSKQLGVRLTR